jgi:murein DD-endopeptidase MepM/ murein hydrolase activator NlpD
MHAMHYHKGHTTRKTTAQFLLIALMLVACVMLGTVPQPIKAETLTELRQKIEERNDEIKKLEKEIAAYQAQVEQVGKEANSLQNTIKQLDLSRKKLLADRAITQNRITATTLTIEKLALEIGNKENNIADGRTIIGTALRQINEKENNSFIETYLSYEDLGEYWNDIENLNQFQGELQGRVLELKDLKKSLEDNKKETEAKKRDLVKLKAELEGKAKAIESNQKEKAALLAATKNQEANYKALLQEKIAKRAQFEKELFEFESQLRIAVDPTKIPSVGKGILAWPLDNVTITQYFGNTPFATQNPQIYNGKGHTGVDFRASLGTRIKASASGVVEGTGNTDLVPGCYSYGKWIMIKHNNGLSTLYAHLSSISVTKGQTVTVGDVIGYSGSTGYSTGPHLHFGVYASQGVKIVQYANSINCKNAVIPIADPKAYLNPLSYL